MRYFATITPTRHGYTASFSSRCEPSALTFDLVGPTRWRRTRRGIERSAGRVLRRLNGESERKAASYEYVGAD